MTRFEYAMAIFFLTWRAAMCRIGLHHDGTDAFGGYSKTCLRCRRLI